MGTYHCILFDCDVRVANYWSEVVSKLYIEGDGWGITIGRLNMISGEPVGVHFWSLPKKGFTRFLARGTHEWYKVFWGEYQTFWGEHIDPVPAPIEDFKDK